MTAIFFPPCLFPGVSCSPFYQASSQEFFCPYRDYRTVLYNCVVQTLAPPILGGGCHGSELWSSSLGVQPALYPLSHLPAPLNHSLKFTNY